jgi:hypothetical protein
LRGEERFRSLQGNAVIAPEIRLRLIFSTSFQFVIYHHRIIRRYIFELLTSLHKLQINMTHKISAHQETLNHSYHPVHVLKPKEYVITHMLHYLQPWRHIVIRLKRLNNKSNFVLHPRNSCTDHCGCVGGTPVSHLRGTGFKIIGRKPARPRFFMVFLSPSWRML